MEILRSKLSQAHNGCQKGTKCLRNHRKMTKKHAKKWLNKEMKEKKNQINFKFQFKKKTLMDSFAWLQE